MHHQIVTALGCAEQDLRVVLSGWSLTLLVCIAVIGAAIYMSLTKGSIDAPVKDWASTCLGFLFGAFVGLVKDFIKG